MDIFENGSMLQKKTYENLVRNSFFMRIFQSVSANDFNLKPLFENDFFTRIYEKDTFIFWSDSDDLGINVFAIDPLILKCFIAFENYKLNQCRSWETERSREKNLFSSKFIAEYFRLFGGIFDRFPPPTSLSWTPTFISN